MKKIILLSLISLLVFKLNAQDGALDPTFGTAGFVRLGINYEATAFTTAGKLLAAQKLSNGFTLTRYKADGTIDETFGNGGSITMVIPYFTGSSTSSGTVPSSVLVAVQGDNNIIVDIEGGTSYTAGSVSYIKQISLARFTGGGALDASFGNGGMTTQYFRAPISTFYPDAIPYTKLLAVQSDGKIVAARVYNVYRQSTAGVVRYNSNGTIDRGWDTPSYGQFANVNALALDENDKIFASISSGGTSTSAFPQAEFLMRFNDDGTTTQFGTLYRYGFQDPNIIYSYTTLATQKEGKIVAGNSNNSIYRFNSDGTTDATFGSAGTVTTSITINKILIDKNNKIIVGGTLNGNFALARFNSNGTPDPTFGSGGITTTDFGGTESIQNMAIVGNRLLAYGSGIIAAYQLAGCTPPTFQNNNLIILDATCNNSDGAINIIPTSGTAPFMYSINGGATYVAGPNTGYGFQNLPSGTYQLRLKDANGCESEIVERVVKLNCVSTCTPPTFVNNGLIILDATCANNDGNINIIPTGGTAPFMYSINGGATYVPGPNAGYGFQNLPSGTYKLRLKDAKGCESAIVEREVKLLCATTCTPPTFVNNGLIVLDASCGKSDGAINIIPTSGTPPFMYSINGGTTYVAGPNAGYGFQNLRAGTYQLRLKDARGCESAILERTVRNYYNCAGVTVSTNTFAAPLLSNKDVIATYPNPNNGQFKLLLQNFTSPKAEVSIYDAKGTLIQKRSINLTQNTIADFHLKGKAAGLYLIKVVTANGTKDIKVVVQ
jgi:uncharacterized delta-60 repeat protein